MSQDRSEGFAAVMWLPLVMVSTLGIWTFVTSRSYLGLALGTLATIICAPPVQRVLQQRYRGQRTLKSSVLALIILCAFQSILGHFATERRAEEKIAEAGEAKSREAAHAFVRDQQFFAAHKDDVLADLDAKVAAGQVQDAAQYAARYRVSDPDLVRRKDAIEALLIKLELRGEASMTLERKAQHYRRLAELEPFDRVDVEKAKALGDQLAAEKAQLAATQQTAATAAARKASIDQQFSHWDGSNLAVEAAVKQQMKNPDSYKHVETRYVEAPNGLIVTTTFRGTNSFNAIVTQRAVAAVDLQGRVLSLTVD